MSVTLKKEQAGRCSYQILREVKTPKLKLDHSLIIQGDAASILKSIPDNSVQCAITSPPYWGLRDYKIDGQIGLEDQLSAFINKLVSVFSEMKRILKDDGIFWLNIGDGYTSGNRKVRAPDKKNPARAMKVRPDTPLGLKPKDLLGIPWRLAFAVQSDGWYLRNDIIWHKPNAMPESVKDRPSRCHEYLFMFTKSEKYYYDHKAVMELSSAGKRNRIRMVDQYQTFSRSPLCHFSKRACFPLCRVKFENGRFCFGYFFRLGNGWCCESGNGPPVYWNRTKPGIHSNRSESFGRTVSI